MNTSRIEILIEDVSYALTSVETDGGMYSFWYCQSCAATGTPNVLAPDSDAALQAAREHLQDHHYLVHGAWKSLSKVAAKDEAD